jgi:hypothetical protein
MLCYKCNTENTGGRKYCRECGSLIVRFCLKCGFGNHLTDKYCGSCGESLTHIITTESIEVAPDASPQMPAGKYSKEDISELFRKADHKMVKTKEKKETQEASQDVLDNIFSSDKNDSDTQEK